MRSQTSVVLLPMILVSGCTLSPSRIPEPTVRATGSCDQSREEIEEAFFRYVFDHNASGAQKEVSYYFLGVEADDDPSKSLLARFKSHVPAVRPISEAWYDDLSQPHHRQDRKGMSQNLVFRLKAFNCVALERAVVEGGYHAGNLSASGSSYTIERRSGLWVVIDERRRWIS